MASLSSTYLECLPPRNIIKKVHIRRTLHNICAYYPYPKKEGITTTMGKSMLNEVNNNFKLKEVIGQQILLRQVDPLSP